MPLLFRLLAIITGGVITYIDPIFAGGLGVIISSFFIVLGLVSLVWGGEMLVGGSSSVAQRMGIPPIVVGLTILAFGTSAPELFVNLIASARGEAELLISNVIGSNISNLLFIGGATALVSALPVKQATIRKEIPLSIFACVLLFFLMNDTFFFHASTNVISLLDGIVLLTAFVFFLMYIRSIVRDHKHQQIAEEVIPPKPTMKPKKSLFFIVFGIYSLYVGGDLIVNYASILAEMFGVSKVLIGASIVAIGTSVPELVTSVIAASRNETDMAVGNIIGSNLFNIFWIAGVSALIKPIPVDTILNLDIIILVIATCLLWAIAYFDKDKRIERGPGILFLLLYVGYIVFLIRRG